MTGKRWIIAYVVLLVMLVGAAASLRAALEAFSIQIYKDPIRPESGLTLPSLPKDVEGFTMVFESPPLSKEIQATLGTENYFSRIYAESEAPSEGARPRTFEFHTAYYTGSIDTVPHVPERCFTGSGNLSIDGRYGEEIRVPLDLGRFPVDPDVDASVHGEIRRGRTSPSSRAPGVRVRLPKGISGLTMNVTRFQDNNGNKVHAGYFFVANGKTAPRAEDVRGLAFSREATHAYYMKVQFTSSDVADGEELAGLAARFLNESFPDLMRRTPDWVDVAEGRHPATREPSGSGEAASSD